MHVDPFSPDSRRFFDASAGIHELGFAADAALAFARPALLKPGTLGGRQMGIDARLKRESGEVLGEVGDPRMILSRAAQRDLFVGTRLLKYLVPWGDTVFNQAQADDLATDIADVKRANPDPQLREILTQLEPLIALLSRETHAYLWFVGD
jgi:hypothetical protein